MNDYITPQDNEAPPRTLGRPHPNGPTEAQQGLFSNLLRQIGRQRMAELRYNLGYADTPFAWLSSREAYVLLGAMMKEAQLMKGGRR